MPYATVTLSTGTSSAPGASAPVALDWRNGSPTSVLVYPSAVTSAWWTVQYTLDDLQFSDGTVVWVAVTNPSSAVLLLASSMTGLDGSLTVFSGPIAGVRLFSSGLSGVLTAKVIQGAIL